MPSFFNQVQLDSNAISNGTIPLAQVDYIKGAFKVMTSAEASSLSAFEQWDPGQIVYFTDSSSLWQYTYVPFNPGAGVFAPYSYFKEIEFYPSFVSASFDTSNDSLTLFANSLEDGDVDSSGNRGPNSQVSMSIDLSSLAGGGGSVNTSSLMTTASAALNVLTFTKGNGDQFSVTIDTGSGGSGTPASPLNSIQFNDNGSFGGDPRFVFNPSTGLAQISGSLQITSSVSDDVFIIKSGDTDLFKVQNDGVVVFASQSVLPTAVEGGMVYSASAFYVGVE